MTAVGEVEAPDHDVRAVLRITPFRRLWIALGLSSLGDWLGLLATAAMAGSLTAGSYTQQNFAIAGVFLVRLLPALVLGPFAGAFADRLDRRATMVLGDLLRFVLFASIALVGTLPWLYLATIAVECVALFWGPATDATIPNLVPRRRLEAANQLGLVATYGSAPLAALLYSLLSVLADGARAVDWGPAINPVTVALWANAITFLVSGLVIWRLAIPPGRGADDARQVGVVRSIMDGYAYAMRTPVVRGLVLGMLGAFAAGGFVVGLAQTFVADLGAGQAGFGMLFGSVFTGLAGGMWAGPRLLVGLSRRRLFGLALTAAGVCLLLLAAVPNLVLAVAFTLALGFCGGVAWVIGYTLLGLEVGDEVRGRTFGFVHSATRVVLVAVLALGPALAALVGTHAVTVPWGVRLTYNGAAWVFALAGVIAVVNGLGAYRQMDDRRGVPLRSDLLAVWAARRHGASSGMSRAGEAPERAHPGWFIAFEGGDGTGKSTQARELAAWLRADQGHDVVLTREPGATAVGLKLREVLLGEGEHVGPRAEALLFAADRAHHVDSLIRPALARGAIVITDRYVDSSIAYQGAGRDLDGDEVAGISRWATGGLIPDLTVLLDVPPEITKVRRSHDPARAGDDRMERLPEDFHAKVREGFLALARAQPNRYLIVDGSLPRDEVQAAIRDRARDLLPISRKRRAELAARLAAEADARRRRAAAEAEVLRLDAELRGRSRDEAAARNEATRRARLEADRQLQAEARRQVEEQRRAEAEEAQRRAEAEEAQRRAEAEEAQRRAEAEAQQQVAAVAEAEAPAGPEQEAAQPPVRPAPSTPRRPSRAWFEPPGDERMRAERLMPTAPIPVITDDAAHAGGRHAAPPVEPPVEPARPAPAVPQPTLTEPIVPVEPEPPGEPAVEPAAAEPAAEPVAAEPPAPENRPTPETPPVPENPPTPQNPPAPHTLRDQIFGRLKP